MTPNFPSGYVRFLAAGSILALAVGCTGCAHTYRVKVNALHNPDVTAGTAFRIVPRDDVKADFDPDFTQNVQLVEQALTARGMYPAAHAHEADVIIEIDYGIGSRRRSVRDSNELFPSATLFAPRSSKAGPESSPTSQSTVPAAAEPVAERPNTVVTVVMLYEKYLTLSARETERATAGLRTPAEAWRVTVALEDPATSVDECLPMLVATAIENIGTGTGRREMIRVTDRPQTLLLATSGR